jgi:hypothetical protein
MVTRRMAPSSGQREPRNRQGREARRGTAGADCGGVCCFLNEKRAPDEEAGDLLDGLACAKDSARKNAWRCVDSGCAMPTKSRGVVGCVVGLLTRPLPGRRPSQRSLVRWKQG